MSTTNTSSSVIAWGGKAVQENTTVSFADVMSEDLAQNLQAKYVLAQV